MDTATALVLATSVMALGAITFSALSLAFQRSHSRKSVRPFCNVNTSNTNTEIIVKIQNAGMGPMRIEKVVLLANADDCILTGIPLEEVFSVTLSNQATIRRLDAYVLAPLQEVEIFRCVCSARDDEARAFFTCKLGGHCLCIAYSDIYDDVYEKRQTLNV